MAYHAVASPKALTQLLIGSDEFYSIWFCYNYETINFIKNVDHRESFPEPIIRCTPHSDVHHIYWHLICRPLLMVYPMDLLDYLIINMQL